MCPTAISMNAYVLRIHILPYVVELCSESVLTRHPDTGLALGQTCQSGRWRKSDFSPTVTIFQGDWRKSLNMGKQTFCSINRVYGTDSTPQGYLRCNVTRNLSTGEWFLTMSSGIAFNYCDAVCFK
ncbi:hypothetical protein NKD49_002331 [Salmonella enterica]|nr:hypothetical protein [Salmonella enterica]